MRVLSRGLGHGAAHKRFAVSISESGSSSSRRPDGSHSNAHSTARPQPRVRPGYWDSCFPPRRHLSTDAPQQPAATPAAADWGDDLDSDDRQPYHPDEGPYQHDRHHHPVYLPGSMSHLVHAATDFLPHQGILENFIHHNPLKRFEGMQFDEARRFVRSILSYMSPGERMAHLANRDPRKRVKEALVDLSSSFLDRGAAKWAPSYRHRGFLYFFAVHEGLGMAPWRRDARLIAENVLARLEGGQDPDRLAEEVLEQSLRYMGIRSADMGAAVRSMLVELRGWSGAFHRMETHPAEAPGDARVRLVEFAAVQSVLMRSSMVDVALSLGWLEREQSLGEFMADAPHHHDRASAAVPVHPSSLACPDHLSRSRVALEAEYEATLLSAIDSHPISPVPTPPSPSSSSSAAAAERPADPSGRPAFQVYCCIDDREGSVRRHMESLLPEGQLQTYGMAGFFGVPVVYQPADGRDPMTLAPEGQQPKARLVERACPDDAGQRRPLLPTVTSRRKLLARLGVLFERASFSPTGSLVLSLTAGPLALAQLVAIGFFPEEAGAARDRLRQRFLPAPKTDFDPPYGPDEAATLLARTFGDSGAGRQFAPLVLVMGHGASSVNNPFAAAYNCGACGGRDGGPNARLLARLANDRRVRRRLGEVHGLVVPDDTVFVGASHNTTSDAAAFYDLDLVPASHRALLDRMMATVNSALGLNALERCRRFMLADSARGVDAALRHVRTRSVDAAEARPELNHATNAAVVVGRRELTRGVFMDRRVFLPSYDPAADDAAGTRLERVLTPALNVCSGINLEYLFSTTDAEHSAGTKAPLNVVGNIGVMQGTAGDLRTGLPSQMTEMHVPLRALFVVDAPVERVEAVLGRQAALHQMVHNEWVRLIVRDPADSGGRYTRLVHGQRVPVEVAHHVGSALTHVPFERQRECALEVTRREERTYRAALAATVLASAGPLLAYGSEAMNARGPLIVLACAALSLPVLAFGRRYLHGEFVFGRFALLTSALVMGFSLVAVAPTLHHALVGWSLFGFASTFLIGSYNDRVTVRNNASFAFASYQLSDMAMLVATAFGSHDPATAMGGDNLAAATGALLLAALFKSSQFPLTALFVRSMEGPTPASALGYAGLSAHVGVVLLTSTMSLWFPFDWARATVAAVGLVTVLYASFSARIRSDRKGAIATATSGTLGLIFVLLAAGHSDLALLLSLGHAAFRMIQVLKSPDVIARAQELRAALQETPWPRVVPDWLYRLSWTLRRFHSDFHLLNVLHRVSQTVRLEGPPLKLPKLAQVLLKVFIVVMAGLPLTPYSHWRDVHLLELLHTSPLTAAAIMIAQYAASVLLVRFLFLRVLDVRRFLRDPRSKPAEQAVREAAEAIRKHWVNVGRGPQ